MAHEFGDHLSAVVLRRMDTIDNFALNGLRDLTIINGGGIVALFTMVAQGAQSPFVKHVDPVGLILAAALFAVGLVGSMTAHLLAYFGQQELHVLEQNFLMQFKGVGQPVDQTLAAKSISTGNRFVSAASLAAAASLIAFIAGCGFATCASLKAAHLLNHDATPRVTQAGPKNGPTDSKTSAK